MPVFNCCIKMLEKRKDNFVIYYNLFSYVGYFFVFWFPQASALAPIPSPQTVWPDRDRSGSDPVEPSSKSNYSSCLKLGERYRVNSFWNFDISDPDQIGSDDGCSSTWTIEAGWRSCKTTEAICDNQHALCYYYWYIYHTFFIG